MQASKFSEKLSSMLKQQRVSVENWIEDELLPYAIDRAYLGQVSISLTMLPEDVDNRRFKEIMAELGYDVGAVSGDEIVIRWV